MILFFISTSPQTRYAKPLFFKSESRFQSITNMVLTIDLEEFDMQEQMFYDATIRASKCVYDGDIPKLEEIINATEIPFEFELHSDKWITFVNHSMEDPTKQERYVKYPLISIAAKYGQYEMFEFLISKGSKLHFVDEKFSHVTPMLVSVRYGHLNIVSKIIDYSCVDINYQDSKKLNYTPLMEAVKSGNIEITKLLLENKASVHCKSCFDGHTPLSIAIELKRLDITTLLIQYGATMDTEKCQDLFTKFVIKHCSIEMIEYLLKHGANPNHCIRHTNYTPLKFAVGENRLDVLKLLFQYGMVAGEKSTDLLLDTIDNDNLEMLKILLENRVNPNYEHYVTRGSTPLCRAIQAKRVDIVEWLVKHNAILHDSDLDLIVNLINIEDYKLTQMLLRSVADIFALLALVLKESEIESKDDSKRKAMYSYFEYLTVHYLPLCITSH